jgi:hypothetical protein
LLVGLGALEGEAVDGSSGEFEAIIKGVFMILFAIGRVFLFNELSLIDYFILLFV